MTAQLHTMLFEWAHRHGSSGVGASETSMPHEEEVYWAGRLLPLVSLPAGHHDTGSTCYLRYGDDVALLHRWPIRDDLGRESTRTQALIGPPELLTFTAAVAVRTDVALEHCKGGPFPELPDPWRLASEPESELHKAAKRYAKELAVFVARVREAQAEDRFSIIAPPESRRVLLWAAHRAFAHVPTAPWTFSTMESSGSGDHEARFVFVEAGGSRNSWQDDRVRIDVSRTDSAPPELHRQTARWIDEGLNSVPAPPTVVLTPAAPAAPAAPAGHSPALAMPTATAVAAAAPAPVTEVRAEREMVSAQPPPAVRPGEPPSRAELADYPLLVVAMTLVSLVFVLFLMWAGSW